MKFKKNIWNFWLISIFSIFVLCLKSIFLIWHVTNYVSHENNSVVAFLYSSTNQDINEKITRNFETQKTISIILIVIGLILLVSLVVAIAIKFSLKKHENLDKKEKENPKSISKHIPEAHTDYLDISEKILNQNKELKDEAELENYDANYKTQQISTGFEGDETLEIDYDIYGSLNSELEKLDADFDEYKEFHKWEPKEKK